MISPKFPAYDYTLVVRTDFSDDGAWAALESELQRPRTEHNFAPSVELVSDKHCEGLGPSEVSDLLPEDPERAFIFIVDAKTLTDKEHPLLVLELETGNTFRVVPTEAWSVENNLRLANMDFEEFHVACSKDGVFRGFSAP